MTDLQQSSENAMDWGLRTGRISPRAYELVTGRKAGTRSVAAAVAPEPVLSEPERQHLRRVAASASVGCLPAFCSSGIDPEELRAVPQGAWTTIAVEPDLDRAQAMVRELSNTPRAVMASVRSDAVAALDDDQVLAEMFGPDGPQTHGQREAKITAKYRQGGIL